ncbi:MAG TPA: histidine--tRNA ligase [Flavobacteriales bacterium]|nr:histidine--tRNA ligase [Flavobacteriales bacterium]
MASKVGIPRGTRDFDSATLAKRDYIFNTIKGHFKLYGYTPIETPSFENTETLMGKYGDEGDKLIYKIINSGDFLAGIDENALNEKNNHKILKHISEKALRYDLTVPFARYVVQHRNEISLPFKRYQIQPVWRADKPQRGRYREFYQCDADVIGSNSLNNEVELVQLMDGVFSDLKIPVIIKLNNRKILSGIAEVCGAPEKITDITVAIDKLDKIGKGKVKEELGANGLSADAIAKIEPLFGFTGNNQNKLDLLRNYLATSEIGKQGIEEIVFVLDNSAGIKHATLELDVTLARGLNYYTGAIFEVKSAAGELKVSICGGGRYDNLTGIFGWEGVSGVGISFGADRIYDVLEELNLFPADSVARTKVMIVNFGGNEEKFARQLAIDLRAQKISCELYPDKAKMDKQMKYANNRQVEFVIIAGSNEIADGKVTLKNMNTGEQQLISTDEIISKL